ncbi:MAG: orotate phosphoribosyltransferase [Bryobacteraceae bacterium]|nr:orotate phosphoribosyltransferase [Bryobacteraceae bacterium]
MPLSDREVLDLFRQTGAFLEGHFRLSSGLHSPKYLQCALVLQHPRHAETLGRALAELVKEAADVVVSPAMGGLIIGHEVARALGVRHIFAERGPDRQMTLRRGFRILPGERALIVEDVITTGGSSKEVADLVRRLGGEVVAAVSIIDRSGGSADLGVPRRALAVLSVEAWPPEQCPLCAQGLPQEKPGSRPA